MDGPATVALPGSVAPGQTVDLSIDLTAPDEPGSYTGNWKLRNDNGVIFGLGDESKPFWVKIKVEEPTPEPFAVTSASFTMTPPTHTGFCPFPITFEGKMKVNGPGTVTYTYQREDGFVSPEFSITFAEAGEKPLEVYVMPVGAGPGYSFTGKFWLRVESPNHQNFDERVTSIICVAP